MTDTIAFFGAPTITDEEENLLTILGRLLAYGGIDTTFTKAKGATQFVRTGYAEAGGKPQVTEKIPYDRPWIVYINPQSAEAIIDRFPLNAPETTWISGQQKLEAFLEATMAVLDERGLLPMRP